MENTEAGKINETSFSPFSENSLLRRNEFQKAFILISFDREFSPNFTRLRLGGKMARIDERTLTPRSFARPYGDSIHYLLVW